MEISGGNNAIKVRYTVDGSDPSETSGDWVLPGRPVQIARGKALKTRMFNAEGIPADRVEHFQLRAHLASGRAVETTPAASTRYPGNSGNLSLTDGLLGAAAANDAAWQGFEGDDVQWTIDLGEKKRVEKCGAGFLVATANWIFPPEEVRISVSDDGQNFAEVARVAETLPTRHMSTFIKRFETKVGKKARFVRITAKNVGLCPDWHQGKGNKAWIFVDEVVVE
ncbi:MAG: discoidin domain-containing protein [Lewinellaceae bacterium]|nr:discoidin domain-containing protein [Lewinellaceae bacterium]